MKTIALYFSGRILAYEHGISNILALKNKYNITFFCSLNTDKITPYEQKFFELLNISENQYHYGEVVYPEWIFHLDPQGKTVFPKNLYSQFYNNLKCFELIQTYEAKNNHHFDCIVKYRADILSHLPMDIDVENIEEGTIYIPKEEYDYTGINDQIAYGCSNVMKIYSALCLNIPFYCIQQNVAFHPETLHLHNIMFHNMKIVRTKFDYILNPMRKNN